MSTNKEKGDLLEKIVGQLCSGIKGANVTNDARLIGKSGVTRQIDTLIDGRIGTFAVTVLVDSKNHLAPVDINEVESIAGMVSDVGANLGVIICPAGFTDGAKKRAADAGVQLYEIFDESLSNSNLLIPIRYVEGKIAKYNFGFSGTSAAGPFSIPMDLSRCVFHIDGKALKKKEVPVYIWNEEMVPQNAGSYEVVIGAVKITDTQDKNYVQYCDLKVGIIVEEDYYLKLFPASFIRPAGTTGKEHFDLRMDIYSKKEDMLKNGWQSFDSLEEMNKVADIDNQPDGVRELLVRNYYSIDDPSASARGPRKR